MKEFTERHHAFIAASFYALLVERFEKRGEAAFVHATQRYAEMCIRDRFQRDHRGRCGAAGLGS